MFTTPYSGGGLSRIPTDWLNQDWIRSSENHPGYDALKDEYDYSMRDRRGMVHSLMVYTNHGPDPKRNPTPYYQSYYYFASTALYMLTAPEELGLRQSVVDRLNGSDVVAQVRKFGAPNCTLEGWGEEHDNNRVNILHQRFGALWARIFNAEISSYFPTSAEPLQLKVEPRKARYLHCPHCKVFYAPILDKIVGPEHPDYQTLSEEHLQRASYRALRDSVG